VKARANAGGNSAVRDSNAQAFRHGPVAVPPAEFTVR